MSSSILLRLHPITGAPLLPVGYRKNGRPIYPILGAAETDIVAPPSDERPEGVSDAEWAALGDPGKAALVRERQARTAAEQALAAARGATPPKPAQPKPVEQVKGTDGQSDIAALVAAAVQQAIGPLQETLAQRDAEAAAQVIRSAVATAAAERFHDATDALAQLDLASLTDGNARPDPAKITDALDELLARKPHLGKAVDNRRRAAGGALIGGAPGGAALTLEDRVKEQLALMASQP